MIYYEDFVKLAKKYSLHIYNTDCYLSCNILWNDELMIMTYNCKEGFVKFYPKITLYDGNIEVRKDKSYDIHTLEELENALENFIRHCKELKIKYKKESIEKDFK